VWRFWHEIRRYDAVFVPFLCSVVLYGFAVQWNSTASSKGSASWWFEESLELAGGVALLTAYAIRLRIAGGKSRTRMLD